MEHVSCTYFISAICDITTHGRIVRPLWLMDFMRERYPASQGTHIPGYSPQTRRVKVKTGF